MFRILFVCHANVCRSPICEFVMKELVKKKGLDDDFVIGSAGTDSDLGCDIWFASKRVMDANGIPWESREARTVTEWEYGQWDLFSVMDYENLNDLRELFGGDPEGKVRLLRGKEIVSDPYCHGDFQRTYEEIDAACRSLLEETLRYSP